MSQRRKSVADTVSSSTSSSQPKPASTDANKTSSTIPNRIGSLNFCSTCGNLLDVPGDDDVLACAQCGHTEDAAQYENISIVTRSHPDAFPSILKERRSVVKSLDDNKDLQDGMNNAQEIAETCPECNHPTMLYFTLQMRSADEGSTVFYECPNCQHRFSTNN